MRAISPNNSLACWARSSENLGSDSANAAASSSALKAILTKVSSGEGPNGSAMVSKENSQPDRAKLAARMLAAALVRRKRWTRRKLLSRRSLRDVPRRLGDIFGDVRVPGVRVLEVRVLSR